MASAPVPSMENVTEIVTVVETVEVSEAERIVETIHTVSVLEVSEPEVIVDEVQVVDIVTESITESVAEEVQVIEIISDEGRQGPPGRPGLAEEDIVYAKRMDMVSPEVFYKGEAETGSADDAPVWRIRRITMVTLGDLVDLSEQWADGEAAFVHKWTDRLTLTYQ